MSGTLLPFLAVTSLVMLVPGPSVLYAVTQRLRSGPTAGLVAVLGLECGLAVHVAAAGLGVSALIAASDTLLRVLQLTGAAYLAWLGVRLIASRPRSTDPGPLGEEAPRGLARIFLGGLLVDLLNPKTIIYFVAVLPQFVTGTARVGRQFALLGVCVVALAVLVDGGYALVAGRLVRRGVAPAVVTCGRVVSGVSFLGLATYAVVG